MSFVIGGAEHLPQSPEAEAAVLGSILIDPDALSLVREFLKAEHFWREAHRVIYRAMVRLHHAGSAVDLLTVSDYLQNSGDLADVGGISYITSLANQVPTSSNAEHYARIVLRTSVQRSLLSYSAQVAALACGEAPVDVALAQTAKLLREIDAGVGADDVSHGPVSMEQWYDSVMHSVGVGKSPAIPTGFELLDEHIVGLLGGELTTIMGASGMSKSAFLLEMAMRLIAQGKRVLYVSLEMPEEQLIARMLASRSGVDTRLFRSHFLDRNGVVDQVALDRVLAHYDTVHALVKNLYWRAIPTTDEKLRGITLRQVEREQCDVLLVDYLGLIGVEGREDAYNRTTLLAKNLKSLATEAHIPVITLAQLNRKPDGRDDPRPQTGDLRDSGVIVEASDFVCGLYRPAYYDGMRAASDTVFAEYAELLIRKARDGVAHVCLPLRFTPHSTTYSDWPITWETPRDI